MSRIYIAEAEEQPSKIISALNLQPDDVVADIGAGTGYLSFRIAPILSCEAFNLHIEAAEGQGAGCKGEGLQLLPA